jgi:hypothetical protein
MTHPDRLEPHEVRSLGQMLDTDAELDRLTTHVRGFATMMTELRGQDLEKWIVAVEQGTPNSTCAVRPQPLPRPGRRPCRPDP